MPHLAAASHSIPCIAIARAGCGFAAGLCGPSWAALAAEWYPLHERGMLMSVTSLGQYTGAAMAFIGAALTSGAVTARSRGAQLGGHGGSDAGGECYGEGSPVFHCIAWGGAIWCLLAWTCVYDGPFLLHLHVQEETAVCGASEERPRAAGGVLAMFRLPQAEAGVTEGGGGGLPCCLPPDALSLRRSLP